MDFLKRASWILLVILWTNWIGELLIVHAADSRTGNKSSLRKKSGLTPQGTSKVSSESSKRESNSAGEEAVNSVEELKGVNPMKAISISRVVEICNSQQSLKGEQRRKFFFLKCESDKSQKIVTVPQINHATRKAIEGSTEKTVKVSWRLNLEGANSALVYATLFVTTTLQYSVMENCMVLSRNMVLKGDPKNPTLAQRLYDCSMGSKVQPIASFNILAKVDTYFNLRPFRLYNELERAMRVSQMSYVYKANSKTPEVTVNLHPKYYVLFDKSGNEIYNDMLFIEKLDAIPYIKVIVVLKDENLLYDLLIGKELHEQKAQLARWYRRLLRGIWLPFYTAAMFMLQNGNKVHCDLHTRNIMISIDPNFGSDKWKTVNTMFELATITPTSMKIIDIGNTISMSNPEIQMENDPCKKYERRPYEDIGLLDFRILDPLTAPAKAPAFLPEEDRVYGDDAKPDDINNTRSLIKYYNMKLSKLKASIRSIHQWESCRVKRVNKRTRRLHSEVDKYPCRFIDQREALVEACKILKRYTAEQFMGVPSCNLGSRRK
ncbi:putative signal peptide-containing protein [Cryptosporidium canis]|uniref:Signal peptide-containing protein n=1 Tax=Cryptosporidium canis TaxID=195482 RepID=A0A9D5DKJ2_9CRYT|nr:putative signal peptide-containing protein [Cryptosporidium canis]